MKLSYVFARNNRKIMQIKEATYQSYCDRRAANPDINYKQLAKIYGVKEVEAMEKRYQQDLMQLEYLLNN